jgi:hypothetical protein
LDEIPTVAVEILKDSNSAVRLVTRRLDETHASAPHALMVAGEVIRVEEQEHSPSRLVADSLPLRISGGTGQEQNDSVAPVGAMTTHRWSGPIVVSSTTSNPSAPT